MSGHICHRDRCFDEWDMHYDPCDSPPFPDGCRLTIVRPGKVQCDCDGQGIGIQEMKDRWSRYSFLAYSGLVGVLLAVLLVVVASRVTDNPKHVHIVKDIIPQTDIVWETDYPDPQPLITEPVSKGSYTPSTRERFWSPADLCDDITPNR